MPHYQAKPRKFKEPKPTPKPVSVHQTLGGKRETKEERSARLAKRRQRQRMLRPGFYPYYQWAEVLR